MERALRWPAAVLCLSVLCGCQTGPVAGTVEGEVTLDGAPLVQGDVNFRPVDGNARTASALIADGKFTGKVAPGEMRVEITSPKPTGKKQKLYDTPDSPEKDVFAESIPERYNVRSDLKINVKPGAQQVRFDLKSK